MHATIVTLPGDGVGKEVVVSARKVLEAVAGAYHHEFHFIEYPIGGTSIEKFGTALTEEAVEGCLKASGVLLGAVGDPRYDHPGQKIKPEQGLLELRKRMGVFANLRPVKVYPRLIDQSPLKPERLGDVDMVVVRELTGGLYFGQPKGRFEENGKVRAIDSLVYYDHEIRRIAKVAFELARSRRGKVTSVDKANVLATSRLWRDIVGEVHQDYPDVALEHMLVDTAAMRLMMTPAYFDVIVTENTFGDILTDETSILAGSMGMLPSASLGCEGPGLYEPIHGSAPDIAGKGIANPIGTILSAAMMLEYSLSLPEEAEAVRTAIEKTIVQGRLTRDLGGVATTQELTETVLQHLR